MLKKHLLLSDSPDLLNILESSFLSRQGFRFTVAANGAQAFEYVEERDPLLAILTQEMPGLNGYECCRRIKCDPFLRATPVALVVRQGVDRDYEKCREVGCDGLIYTPFESKQVVDVVCRLLNITERGEVRVSTRFSLVYGVGPRVINQGVAVNLNRGGVFIEADRQFPVDSMVEMELLLPEEEKPVQCRGRIAWVNHPEWVKNPSLPHGMGVRFIDLSERATRAIARHIEEKMCVIS